MVSMRAMLAVCLLTTVAIAQSGGTGNKKSTSKAKPQSAPTSSESSGAKRVSKPKSFDMAAMDKSVDPCDDFYEYACGNWRKNNPIPSDQTTWGRFNELAEYNRQFLHDILEKAAVNNPKRTPVTQKIGDMYQSCMDEAGVEAKGGAPLKPIMDRINAVSSKEQLMETVAYLQSIGIPALFNFNAAADLHNATTQVANVIQGGISLLDRDDYLEQDAKSRDIREKYLEHLANSLVLLGDDASAAKKEAQAVMDIETKLAEASFKRVQMRDPKNRDHKMKVSELAALAPAFQFERYFQSTGSPQFTEVNVVPPDFFQKVNATVDSVSVDDWKTYLRWHAVRSSSPFLSSAFVNENFNFFNKFLNGQKEQQPRWKRCVQLTDGTLGEALGQPYVQATFGAEGKQRMLKMVQQLEAAMAQDIESLDWMTPETKKQAIVKLKAITNKIGYPEKWRDYSTVKITRGDLLGNLQAARSFEIKRNHNKIGKPLDKTEWVMSPPTVNAYYQAAENDINFPAGILQPPFFDKDGDEAANFGGIGVVIGHELTHGFDDQGSKFDAEGNLKNWWTQVDRDEFEKRTGCVADEYSSFVVVDDVHLNGRLTLGENTADNGGLRISLLALRNAMAKDAKINQKKDGFTPDQRYFLGFAQVWCQNQTPEAARNQARTNPHSTGQYRVNGSAQNSSDFAKAFGCKAGQKMVSANACHVW